MKVDIESSWNNQLKEEFDKPYFLELIKFVEKEYATESVYPPEDMIFNAFDLSPFDNTKVVIIGQDPYHGEGQAHGLSFSVKDGVRIPPSLRNIYKELHSDLNLEIPASGDLTRWASQGVLLLNATLTVRADQAGSHQKKGWEQFTDSVIKTLSEKSSGLVFVLWGAYAQKKGAVIDQSKHLILKSVHPSPLSASRGFFGNKQFSTINSYLREQGRSEIVW